MTKTPQTFYRHAVRYALVADENPHKIARRILKALEKARLDDISIKVESMFGRKEGNDFYLDFEFTSDLTAEQVGDAVQPIWDSCQGVDCPGLHWVQPLDSYEAQKKERRLAHLPAELMRKIQGEIDQLQGVKASLERYGGGFDDQSNWPF